MAIGSDTRIHVLAEDGTRDALRVLVDRYTTDLSQRETFVVAQGDPNMDPSVRALSSVDDIAIAPGGDLYYLGRESVGRIHLQSP